MAHTAHIPESPQVRHKSIGRPPPSGFFFKKAWQLGRQAYSCSGGAGSSLQVVVVGMLVWVVASMVRNWSPRLQSLSG